MKAAAPAPAKQQVEPAQTGDKKKKQSKPESAAPAAPAKVQQPAAKANAAKKPAAAAVNVEAKSAPAVNVDNDVVVDQEDDGQWVTQGGKQVRCGKELSLNLISFDHLGQQPSKEQGQS